MSQSKPQPKSKSKPPKWEIRGSKIQGTGVWASAQIRSKSYVLEYVGEMIDKKESAKRCEDSNQYIFHVDDTHDLDGNVDWNPARFINHSCEPNCEAEQDDDNRIWIRAKRRILVGEELTFNYGYDIEDYRDHPCECGSVQCVGYIVAVEHFETLRQRGGRASRVD
jgi:SET domain-containing protein